ncbi:MAG: NAD(P)/FAD-dependent oxidoreductase, partial [Clostridiales bacterium]|nr:NAD(P)/FAD-dependent oxidoreductase [Clostridiales bacterium]
PYKTVNEVTKAERHRLVTVIKGFCIEIVGTMMFNEAVVTSGGISVSDIGPTTMRSRVVEGLSFAGEVIDVDAFTGGFNLQIAFSTAYLAACNI